MRREQGFSLVEVVVGAALLGLVITMVWSLMIGSAKGYSRDSARQMTQDNVRRILDEMAQELRDADAGTFSVPSGSSSTTVTFRKSVGFTAGATVWSANITYSYQTGVIKVGHLGTYEGRVVRNGPTGPTAAGPVRTDALCEYVKPGGFTVSRAGDRVTISLTLRTFDEDKNENATTLSTSIALRNSST